MLQINTNRYACMSECISGEAGGCPIACSGILVIRGGENTEADNACHLDGTATNSNMDMKGSSTPNHKKKVCSYSGIVK